MSSQFKGLRDILPALATSFIAILTGSMIGICSPSLARAQSEKSIDSLWSEIARIERQIKSQKKSHSDWTDKMHFHGYGEMHFNLPKTGTMDDGADKVADLHRFVLGWGYEFTDKIRFDAEIDFEHNASEIEMEYAQLEIDLLPTLSLRMGSLLMPVGSLNEVHEPPNFYSVERPNIHSFIIPTTWQENGIGLSGRTTSGGFSYRLYIVPGLDATGFSSTKGVRGGRSKGIETVMNDLAVTGRLEFAPLLPHGSGKLNLGGSFYLGQADQNSAAIGEVAVNIFSADLRYDVSALNFQGEFIVLNLDGVDSLSVVLGETIGERMFGWYAEVGYHIFKTLAPNRHDDLVVFVRRERFDTNDRVPVGFIANLAADRKVWTTGLAYYPMHKVALKTDIEFWKDGTGEEISRVNAGFAFMF